MESAHPTPEHESADSSFIHYPDAERKIRPLLNELDFNELSPGWNARAFVEINGDRLRYCAANRHWYIWNGKYWEQDKQLCIEKYAQEFIRFLHSKTANIDDMNKRQKWLKHVRYSDTKMGVNSIIDLSRSLGNIPIQYEQFDTSLQLLNCDSGVIDLKSSQLLDHKPEYLMTMIVPHPYIPHTVSPRWLQFLYECTGGNKELIEHLQRAAGSSISGHNPDNKFYLICGPTCTGKTTFLETIRHILNNYAVLTSYNTFLTIRRTSSGEPEMIELQGSRMVIASESNPGESFSPAKIKQYTSKEPIKTRALYSNIMVNITNRGKLWFVTNHPPRIDFSESAMWNRAIRIDFDHQVSEDKQDKRLLDKLISSNNAPGILSWLVEGCVKWYRDHDWNEEYGYKPDFKRDPLQVPESVRMATEQYRFEQCPISGFIDDCCEIDPGNESHSVTVADLREAYDHYVAEHDIQNPLSWKRATEYFRELGLEPGRQGGTGSRMWQYIRLRR